MADPLNTTAVERGYARLPEDLLNDLLQGSDSLVDQVEHLLGTSLQNADRLREALENLNLIAQAPDREPGTACGVDGGFALERTASVDISLSVAVGVEGLSGPSTHWGGTQYTWWSHVGSHHFDAERLCRGVMAAQELEILNGAPHAYRILDGSHLTPVIQLNSALTVASDELRNRAIAQWGHSDTVHALTGMAHDPSVIAMPKYDSSRDVAGRLEAALGEEVPGDDKFLMSLLLEPNEYIAPLGVPLTPTWSNLHFDSPGGAAEDTASALEEAIAPLQAGRINFTYFKPDAYSPAFRAEVKPELGQHEFEGFLSTLRQQMTGPFVREPYPQYLADIMAKSVGLGLSALTSSVQLTLSRRDRSQLAEFLMRSYRTEGI